jgi:ribosomal protein S18 acetylase RimI-like enzyme
VVSQRLSNDPAVPPKWHVRVDDHVPPEHVDELWRVFDVVFGDWPSFDAWRSEIWERHSSRAGFRVARAYVGDQLVGLAYGYTGQPGQWWTDAVAQVLDPGVAEDWLGGHFELVSIGVLAEARGLGVGRELLRRITADLPHDRWLLMTTSDAADPARQLYASEGWDVIGPGIGTGRVVMGKRSSERS